MVCLATLFINSLVQSKGLSISEGKEILTNFQNLKAFVNQTKQLAKKYYNATDFFEIQVV